jgi:hypothetical protein
MVLLRRLLLVWLLMFWLGGFTFYAAVVVPIGTDVLGSPMNQGAITQQVTNWLNVAGAAALAGWAWDVAANPAPSRRRQATRWALWALMSLLLVVLAILHRRLDALFDVDELFVSDEQAFRTLHRAYLWVTTVQWGTGILLSYSTLRAWCDADRKR